MTPKVRLYFESLAFTYVHEPTVVSFSAAPVAFPSQRRLTTLTGTAPTTS